MPQRIARKIVTSVKSSWVALLILGAVGYVSISTYVTRDDFKNQILDNAVPSCVAQAPQRTFNVYLQQSLAQRAREVADTQTGKEAQATREAAANYEAVAQANLDQIPAPKGLKGSKRLVQLQFNFTKDGKSKLSVSPAALKLQTIGCEQLVEKYR